MPNIDPHACAALAHLDRIVPSILYHIRSGLHPDLAIRHQVIVTIMLCMGYSSPRITSGFRSLQKQRNLIEQWDAGNKGGLRGRPASYSWHTVGRAIDLAFAHAAERDVYNMMAAAVGMRVEPSPGHYDLPGEPQPQDAGGR